MEQPSDEVLMLAIQKGDQQAFQQFVDRYMVALHKFAQRMLGNTSDADDVVQETFLRVWQKSTTWQTDKAKVSTWLHRITHNVCIDWQRKPKLSTVALTEIEETATTANEFLHTEMMARQVEQALQQLPERQRSALILCYYQGMRNCEAAQVLNVNVPALESLLARGRKYLKKVLVNQD